MYVCIDIHKDAPHSVRIPVSPLQDLILPSPLCVCVCVCVVCVCVLCVCVECVCVCASVCRVCLFVLVSVSVCVPRFHSKKYPRTRIKCLHLSVARARARALSVARLLALCF